MNTLNESWFFKIIKPQIKKYMEKNPHLKDNFKPNDYRNWWDENKEYCEMMGIPRNPFKEYGFNKYWTDRMRYSYKKWGRY